MMELAHEGCSNPAAAFSLSVSILVMMELAHEVTVSLLIYYLLTVSILVMMELAHEELARGLIQGEGYGFNPCYDGIGSRSRSILSRLSKSPCFNPCYDGIGSRSCQKGKIIRVRNSVSILVMMELAHEDTKYNPVAASASCFNPCYDGIGSRRARKLNAVKINKLGEIKKIF